MMMWDMFNELWAISFCWPMVKIFPCPKPIPSSHIRIRDIFHFSFPSQACYMKLASLKLPCEYMLFEIKLFMAGFGM